ncbi:hypothetical protein UA75_29740 [Actinoalloteichus sp. GBA129-24]|uniref:Uncharacterized protein n=1 Tax=Actinoalloteichus fjordicus TaxID=1612552 RepID=A0AAC9LKJ0_9PSEU|nr:hypothetical protein UA74_29210 [Actinoalloteichus fjordicus]APU23912.1 hypothetical protein UA75_29740 [Actinoalloteichus sp. GBA129-24]
MAAAGSVAASVRVSTARSGAPNFRALVLVLGIVDLQRRGFAIR